MYRVELSEDDIDVAETALSEMERHHQGVAEELFGLTGLQPNLKERDAHLALARQAREARGKLRVKVRARNE